jgi:hypothetical protein
MNLVDALGLIRGRVVDGGRRFNVHNVSMPQEDDVVLAGWRSRCRGADDGALAEAVGDGRGKREDVMKYSR